MKDKFTRICLITRIILRYFRVAVPYCKRPGDAFSIIKNTIRELKKMDRYLFADKVFKRGSRYYWNLYTPGFPSTAFNNVIRNCIEKCLYGSKKIPTLAVIAITKKCALQCEHCFEWEEINNKDILCEQKINEQLLTIGGGRPIGQIFFSGGEPFNRYPLLLRLTEKYSNETECWVISSGRGLTRQRALELSTAGLTGVMISIDSHIAAQHDRFRGIPGTYDDAITAIKQAQQANLLTALSFCGMRGLLTEEFMHGYINFAKELGVSFVQMLEPKQAGKYSDKDILLSRVEMDVLKITYTSYNQEKKYSSFPKIHYPDLLKRTYGCRAGNWYVYVDTNGTVYPCPFCKDGNSCAGSKVADASQAPASTVRRLIDSKT